MCASTVFPRESEDLVTGKKLHQELGGFGEMLPYHPTRADMPYTHVLCTTLMVCVVLCQEPVAGSLEQLWMSYNMVEKLKGITVLKNLKVKKSCSSCECYSVLLYVTVSESADGSRGGLLGYTCWSLSVLLQMCVGCLCRYCTWATTW